MSKMLWGAVLVIRLVNGAKIPESTLRLAERTAAGIFARAGVEVEWADCRIENCESMSGLWVQMIGQHERAAGYAVLFPAADGKGGYAVIRYPVVEAAAKSVEIDSGAALGATIAHEIGHVLLGKAHDGSGVMAPHLGRRELQAAARGELLFTEKEARRIRERLPKVSAR